ncbi:3-deoxy-D-manno-octulosonic acid transferase [Salidesulfovibrio brasiliensis]
MRSSVRAAMSAYSALWRAAVPLLKGNGRLRDGWGERTLDDGLPASADLWIQAASGGEAYLAWEVLKGMKSPFPDHPLRVLCTTNTRQGMDILCRGAEETHGTGQGVAVQCRMFPFDSPSIMRRAVASARPKVALILETEIWPGFLTACKEQGTKVLLANGRMNPRSLAGYLTWPGLFRDLAPDAVMAVSERDAARFATLFGRERVTTMSNIKFDRMVGSSGPRQKDNPLAGLLPKDAPFVVLGSVRRQEEERIEAVLDGLRREAPEAVIGLFPRHMERLDRWREFFDGRGMKWVLRSELQGSAEPGTIILWDTFGELVPAYGMARAVFVGGNLDPKLKGQNFLEPLTCGLRPVIGRYWSSFHWVGREIVESGLVVEVDGPEAVVKALSAAIKAPLERKKVASEAARYIRSRTGGAEAVRKRLAQFLVNE